MRAFLGIPVPETVGEQLLEYREDLTGLDSAKPVARENFHVTVKFLDEINEEQRWQLDNGLQKFLPAVGPLKLEINGFGAFPDPSFPRVIWAGVAPQDPLEDVHSAVEEVSENIGVDRDDHDYLPHITLLRLNNPDPHREQVVNWLQDVEFTGNSTFSAPRLVLYESQLKDSGPEYKKLESWPL